MSFRLTPSILLTVLQPWTDVVEPIYKRVAQMADASEWGETLWVGCGSGRSVLWWAQKFGATTQGLDPDPEAVESAEARIRGIDLAKNVTFQVADPSDLPHEDHVFDSVIVHTLYLRGADMEVVLREAVRVLRPMGNVVVIAPSWLQTPRDADSRLIESLGFSPRVAMEWKGHLRDAGAVELTVEEAAKDGLWFAPSLASLVVRGWHAAGWKGARSMLSREVWVLRSLARKRVLGLLILKGARWPHN
jgi:SAM-dependent methyltransferase